LVPDDGRAGTIAACAMGKLTVTIPDDRGAGSSREAVELARHGTGTGVGRDQEGEVVAPDA
jgi:hypothetical protein